MGIKELDKVSGYLTTGHEWNGITELNTKVPKAVWIFLLIAFVFSVICWILFPAWPLGDSFTKGMLETDQKKRVETEITSAKADRTVWMTRILKLDFSEILADPTLISIVRENGSRLYLDNCAACHGGGAEGGPGFPALNDGVWLWGGSPDNIMEIIRVGVNSGHDEGRSSEMLAFGRGQLLSRAEILAVVDYLRGLSDKSDRGISSNAEDLSGQSIFLENCASCHGEDAKGNLEIGAPNLTDDFWLYGGSRAEIFNTIWNGRQGHMPSWEKRLSEPDRKILALYLMKLPGEAGNTDTVTLGD